MNTKETHLNSTLLAEDVLEIVRLHDEEGVRQADLAKMYSRSQCSISHLITGRSHGHITGRHHGGVDRRPSHVTRDK